MMTNAGVKVLDTEANVPNFGRAMFDTNQTANVFGFSHLVQNFCVTYDSDKEDAFIVHTNCGQVKFVNRERLYVYEPSQNYLELIKDMKKLNESAEKKPEKWVHFKIKDDKVEEKKDKNGLSKPPQSTKMCQVIPSVTKKIMKYTKQQIK